MPYNPWHRGREIVPLPPIRIDGGVCYVPVAGSPDPAIADACNADLLGEYRWVLHKSARCKYAQAYLGGRGCGVGPRVSMHRLVMRLGRGGPHVDHINQNGLDNRLCNLRLTNPGLNLHNSRLSARNKSGFKGVLGPYPSKRRGLRWTAHIGVGYHVAHLGTFPSACVAAVAYDIAALLLVGNHAATNLSLGLLPEELKEEILSKVVGIKLPDHEYKRWAEQADKERLTVPKWVRKQIAVAARSVVLPESVHTKAVSCTDAVVDVVPPPFSFDWAEWDGSQLLVGFTENFESSTTAFKPTGKKPLDSLIVQVNEWGLAHGVTTDAGTLVRDALKERGE